jgi:signal transduction histidine kinase
MTPAHVERASSTPSLTDAAASDVSTAGAELRSPPEPVSSSLDVEQQTDWPKRAERHAAAIRPGRSLSWRLFGLVAGVLLLAEALLFVPQLARERRIWIDRRVAEAQIAALSVASVRQATLSQATTDELLRLSGAVLIELDEPGRGSVRLSPATVVRPDQTLDTRDETFVERMWRGLTAIVRPGDRLLQIEAQSPQRPTATMTLVLHQRELNRALREFTLDAGLMSLLEAAIMGIMVYVVAHLLLVRPMRRIIHSIVAFRADPERSAPFHPTKARPMRDDEIALAGRELAAMQRELRTALWRNARLAALGTAVAKVSHDLRGILSPALLTAERLQMSNEASIKRAGDILVRSVDRATELVSRTLEFAREGRTPPARTRTSLRPMVDEAAEQVRVTQPALMVANDVAAAVEIDADAEQIARVLVNLVGNAAEAKARRVRVQAEAAPTRVMVTISDDGPGLPDQVRDNLFRPFVIGGRSGGTGLGLAIARDLMRAHDGDLTLEATGPTGTTFKLCFRTPAARPRRASPPAAAAQAASPSPDQGLSPPAPPDG